MALKELLADLIVNANGYSLEHELNILDLLAAKARIAELEKQIAQGTIPKVLFGSSAKPGNVEAFLNLNYQLGVKLQSWRIFENGPRLDSGTIATIVACKEEGALPLFSVTLPSSTADTQWNIDALKANGLESIRGGYCMAHEPTQKHTAEEFRGATLINLPLIQAQLPQWERTLIFMRWDFALGGVRHPRRYLPSDRSLITRIGVDVYDSNKEKGSSFASLMKVVEDFSILEYGFKKIWVAETACPDLGDYLRPVGWRALWIAEMAAHANASELIDLVDWFSSDIGPNSPPRGWWIPTSVESVGAFVRVLAGK